MSLNDLEDKLPELMNRAARGVAPSADPMISLRHRLAAEDHRNTARSFPRMLAPVSLVVVIVVLAGSMALLRNARVLGAVSSSHAKPTPTATATPAPGVTVNGITIKILKAYADTTRTLVEYSLSGGPASYFDGPMLRDASGQVYSEWGEQALNGWTSLDPNAAFLTNTAFTPLPASDLGHAQTLSFVINEVIPFGDNGVGQGPLSGPAIKGPWIVPFTVTPVPARSTSLTIAPITHDGITITPTEVDVTSNTAIAFDGNHSFARVILHMSGFPAQASLTNMIDTATFAYCFTPQRTFCHGLNLPGRILLSTGGGGIAQIPACIYPVNPSLELDKDGQPLLKMFGPSRSADFEVTFLVPQTQASTATLVIDNLQYFFLATPPPYPYKGTVVSGTWSFTIPLG